MPDGAILISDDRGNRLIRVSYAVLTIECPGGGNRMKETLRNLGGSPQLRCVAWASLLKIDGEQVRVALATLEAAAKAMLDGGVRKIG